MFLILIVILTIVMLATSVALYSFVDKLAALYIADLKWYWMPLSPFVLLLGTAARIVDRSAFGQMIFNFLVSSVIMIFTGAGLYAGAANLIASLLFPFAIIIRKKILNRN